MQTSCTEQKRAYVQKLLASVASKNPGMSVRIDEKYGQPCYRVEHKHGTLEVCERHVTWTALLNVNSLATVDPEEALTYVATVQQLVHLHGLVQFVTQES